MRTGNLKHVWLQISSWCFLHHQTYQRSSVAVISVFIHPVGGRIVLISLNWTHQLQWWLLSGLNHLSELTCRTAAFSRCGHWIKRVVSTQGLLVQELDVFIYSHYVFLDFSKTSVWCLPNVRLVLNLWHVKMALMETRGSYGSCMWSLTLAASEKRLWSMWRSHMKILSISLLLFLQLVKICTDLRFLSVYVAPLYSYSR